MAGDWYITRDGMTISGPFSPQQLRKLAGSSRLLPTDLLRQGLDADWVSASQVRGLFAPAEAGPPGKEAPPAAPAAPSKVLDAVPVLVEAPPVPPPTNTFACPHCAAPITFHSEQTRPTTCFRCLGPLPVPGPAAAVSGIVPPELPVRSSRRWLGWTLGLGALLVVAVAAGVGWSLRAQWNGSTPAAVDRPAPSMPVSSLPPAAPPPAAAPTPAPATPPAPGPWQGHTATIQTVAFSSDGSQALSGSGGFEMQNGVKIPSPDNAVRLWDSQTGEQLKCLKGFKDGINAVAFSPDGKFAALCSAGQWKGGVYHPGTDFSVRLWDVTTGKELTKIVRTADPTTEDASQGAPRFQGHTDEVYGIAFSPNGRQLLSASRDGSARLWDVESGKELRQLIGHTNTVYRVAFSADGQRALTCSADRTVRLWDLTAGRELRRLVGHKDIIWTAAFSPDGKLAVSAGGNYQEDGKVVRGAADYEVRLWDLETGKELRRFRGHQASVSCVAFTNDGRYLVSCASPQLDAETDYSIRLWHVATGKELRRFAQMGVMNVAISPDSRHVLAGGEKGSLRLWPMPARLEDLNKALQDHDAKALAQVVKDVEVLAPDLAESQPLLLAALREPDAAYRALVFTVLKQSGSLTAAQIPALIPLLSQPAAEVRNYAVTELTRLGTAAAPATAALVKVLQDSDAALRRLAAQALGAIGAAGRETSFPALAAALRDPDEQVQAAVIAALRQLGQPAPADVPTLAAILKCPAADARQYAAAALAQLGAAAAAAVPQLQAALKDDVPGVRLQAVLALGKIGPKAKAAAAALVQAARDRDDQVRRSALSVLLAIGLDSKEAAPVLIAALKDADLEVRRAALAALDKVGAAAIEAVPVLSAGLQDADREIRRGSAAVLGKLGPNAWRARKDLAKALTDPEREVRKAAAVALGQMGEKAGLVADSLVAALKTSDLKEEVTTALIQIGKAAVPELIEALEAVKGLDRLPFIAILGDIGPPAKAAVPVLSSIAEEKGFPSVRKAATEALARIQGSR